MISEIIDHYADVVRNVLDDDICWTVVRPRSGRLEIDELVNRMALPAHELRSMYAFDEHASAPESPTEAGRQFLYFDQWDNSVSILQFTGFFTVLPEVAESLSGDAHAWIVNWNVNQDLEMFYWEDGSCTGVWDPYEPREEWATRLGSMSRYADILHEYCIEDDGINPDYRPELRKAAPLAVVELASGVRLDMEWRTREHPTLGIPWP